ncbi:hypothetical protein [Streptomyces scopuliridis]|uniref:hypothetical protein n=1 Tax=Streptomyces scopuliridis TaxID=452529 RepID=UPI0036C3C53F
MYPEIVSVAMSRPAKVVDNRLDASFHDHVPPQETTHPSAALTATMPPMSLPVTPRPASTGPRRTAMGTSANASRPVKIPTVADHEDPPISRWRRKNVALPIP